MLVASLLILAALGCYAVLCAVRPFRDNSRLRRGRRLHNAWTRTRDQGSR
jgi:hypothetical protein